MTTISTFFNKLRPNAIMFGVLVAVVTMQSIAWLLDRVELPVSTELVAFIAGIGLGALATSLTKLLEPDVDKPAPSMPTSDVIKMVELMKCNCGKEKSV